MAFDGIVTRAVARELSDKLCGGKVDKLYQPEKDELVFFIHTKEGKYKLYMSSNNDHPGAYLSDANYTNPMQPSGFCMLMRKHLLSARIDEISQKDTERILEIIFDCTDELGTRRPLKLIIEIMGKHSNIVLIDPAAMRIIDSIKRLSFDVNRVRQILPGGTYEYPPRQDKIPFDRADRAYLDKRTGEPEQLLSAVMGISPLIAREIAPAPYARLQEINRRLDTNALSPCVYLKEDGTPSDFHVLPIEEYEGRYRKQHFSTVSETIAYFYTHRAASNRIAQKSQDLRRIVHQLLKKHRLKRQKLGEDLIRAENAEKYRIYGELLTANIHAVPAGAKNVTLENYYDGTPMQIPLDPRYAPAKNAQLYFKKYAKSKTAIKEKRRQMEENDRDLAYLESTASFIEQAADTETIDMIRRELTDAGYLRRHKQKRAERKQRPKPLSYRTRSGRRLMVGRNNTENDALTFHTADRRDLWFHTKDIPGSHVVLFTEGDDPNEEDIFEAAAAAAWHSKARDSENVPVDYTQIRYVKKPNGAKPGMCIFTHNRTIYVTPKEPAEEK